MSLHLVGTDLDQASRCNKLHAEFKQGLVNGLSLGCIFEQRGRFRIRGKERDIQPLLGKLLGDYTSKIIAFIVISHITIIEKSQGVEDDK